MTQSRWFVTLGAVSGALAVIAGAFGAHGLADVAERDALEVFRREAGPTAAAGSLAR